MEKYRRQGKPIEEVKRKLIESGLDCRLVERFLREMAEDKP